MHVFSLISCCATMTVDGVAQSPSLLCIREHLLTSVRVCVCVLVSVSSAIFQRPTDPIFSCNSGVRNRRDDDDSGAVASASTALYIRCTRTRARSTMLYWQLRTHAPLANVLTGDHTHIHVYAPVRFPIYVDSPSWTAVDSPSWTAK